MKNLRQFSADMFAFDHVDGRVVYIFNKHGKTQRQSNRAEKKVDYDLIVKDDLDKHYEEQQQAIDDLKTNIYRDINDRVQSLRDEVERDAELKQQLEDAQFNKDLAASLDNGNKDKRKVKRQARREANKLMGRNGVYAEFQRKFGPQLLQFKNSLDREMQNLRTQRDKMQTLLEQKKKNHTQVGNALSIAQTRVTELKSFRGGTARAELATAEAEVVKWTSLRDKSQQDISTLAGIIKDTDKDIAQVEKETNALFFEDNRGFIKRLFQGEKVRAEAVGNLDSLKKLMVGSGSIELQNKVSAEETRKTLTESGDFVSLKNAKERNVDDKINEVDEIDAQIAELKKSPHRTATVEDQITELENKKIELQNEIEDARSDLSEQASDLIDQKAADYEDAEDIFLEKQELAVETLEELITSKKDFINLNPTDKNAQRELEKLEQQLEDVRTKNITELPADTGGDTIFADLKAAHEQVKNTKNSVIVLQEELDRIGVEYDEYDTENGVGSYVSRRSSSIESRTLSRIEGKVEREIKTKIGSDLDKYEDLRDEIDYLQKFEIQGLKIRKNTAEARGDAAEASRLETELDAKERELADKQREAETLLAELRGKKGAWINEAAGKKLAAENARDRAKRDYERNGKASDKSKYERLEQKYKEASKYEAEVREQLNEAIVGAPERFPMLLPMSYRVKLNEVDAKSAEIQNLKMELEIAIVNNDEAEKTRLRDEIREKTNERRELLRELNAEKVRIINEGKQAILLEKRKMSALRTSLIPIDTEAKRAQIREAEKGVEEAQARLASLINAMNEASGTYMGRVSASPMRMREYCSVNGIDYNSYAAARVSSRAGSVRYTGEVAIAGSEEENSIEPILYRPCVEKRRRVENYSDLLKATVLDADKQRKVHNTIKNNLHMMTPVKTSKSGVDLSSHGLVVEITPTGLSGYEPKEYSPRYYRVTPEGNFEWISDIKVRHGESFGFKTRYTPEALHDKIRSLPEELNKAADREKVKEYFEKLMDEYGPKGIVKAYNPDIYPPRMQVSPVNDQEDELYDQKFAVEYNPVTNTWKLVTEGLSDVQKKRIDKYGMDPDKSYSQDDFDDCLMTWSQLRRVKQKDESASPWNQFRNWVRNLFE